MSRTSASPSLSRVMCGLCSHRSSAEVRTSVWNRPGHAASRSRTAAVSIKTSPGLWNERSTEVGDDGGSCVTVGQLLEFVRHLVWGVNETNVSAVTGGKNWHCGFKA